MIFSDYLLSEDITSSKEVKKILLNNKFILRDPRANGNNYANFTNKEGYLLFNNPSMSVSPNSVSRAAYTENISGNTLRFNNLLIVLNDQKKENIVNNILKIDLQLKTLEKEKEDLNEKLEFLICTNSDNLILKEYENYKKEKITKNLLEASPKIAEVKI